MKAQALDQLLGTPARLAITATLADGRERLFTELREATGLADGNLHVQVAKLAAGGYLQVRKLKRGARTVTAIRATDEGIEALRRHVQKLRRALENEPPRPAGSLRADGSRVW